MAKLLASSTRDFYNNFVKKTKSPTLKLLNFLYLKSDKTSDK